MTHEKNKTIQLLQSELASLLSFDLDDIDDFFQQLMEFQNEQDLLEYISALLGEVTEKGKRFVKNFIRFQQGLDLDLEVGTDLDLDGKMVPEHAKCSHREKHNGGDLQQKNDSKLFLQNKTPLLTTQAGKKAETMHSVETGRNNTTLSTRQQQPRNQTPKSQKNQELKKQTIMTTKNEYSSNIDPVNTSLSASMSSLKMVSDATVASPKPSTKFPLNQQAFKVEKKKIASEPTKPPPPLKGKAKIVCGCYGTVHKPLTNCLHCGRISCEKEGYDYCPFCSFLIEEVKVVTDVLGEEFDKAVLHKERLLKFDKENAKRTVVYDDQADYFQNSLCTWLNEDERKDALSKEERRRRDLHTIKKHVLDIQF